MFENLFHYCVIESSEKRIYKSISFFFVNIQNLYIIINPTLHTNTGTDS